MDEITAQRLREYKNLRWFHQDFGMFTVELTESADLSQIPAGYTREGRTLRFLGSCRTPCVDEDNVIQLTLTGMQDRVILDPARDVKWMLRHEPFAGSSDPQLRPLWVSDEHRPR